MLNDLMNQARHNDLLELKSPFPEVVHRRHNVNERKLQAFVGSSLPFVDDVIVRIEDRL